MYDDKLKEECGVVGFYNNDDFDTARIIYYSLYALQHRGQESCGIIVNDNGTINQYKDVGLVNEVFDNVNISNLKGKIGVGHVRYSTKDDISANNAQPMSSNYAKGTLTVAFNGNITNAKRIRQKFLNQGAVFQSQNDVELILHMAAAERALEPAIELAFRNIMTELNGAFSIVAMSPRKLLAMRDPHGFRPLCLGKLNNSWVIASESAGLDVIKAKFERDIEPGEIIMIDEHGLKSMKMENPPKPSLCVFEYIYFARPDSVIDKRSVYNTRVEGGRRLAHVKPVEADLVIGVPASGLNFAVGYAEASGIPYGEGLVKNRYTGRTFIKPTQAEREMAVNVKLNVLKANVIGKRIVLIDDSIVRGTTSANIIKMIKDAGAKEVHMRVASPEFLYPCYFGTDISDRKDLAAVKYTTEEIRQRIGADSLAFFPVEELKNIGLRPDFGYCDACFTGKYTVPVEDN